MLRDVNVNLTHIFSGFGESRHNLPFFDQLKLSACHVHRSPDLEVRGVGVDEVGREGKQYSICQGKVVEKKCGSFPTDANF